MTPSHSAKGVRRYRYYTCTNAQRRGHDACPSKSVPAAEIEKLVVDRLRSVGQDPARLRAILSQAREQEEGCGAKLQVEQRGLERDLNGWQAEMRNLSARLRPGEDNNAIVARLAELQECIGRVEQRVGKIRGQIGAIHLRLLDEDDARAVLGLFDPRWEAMPATEQARVVGLLIERVEYDGARGKLSITFRDGGIRALADELADSQEERRA
jgi:site-specific DNA recombinase